MKIRDLTDKQIKVLQKRCKKEFKRQKVAYPGATEDDTWNLAWSDGLKAGLEFVPDTGNTIAGVK